METRPGTAQPFSSTVIFRALIFLMAGLSGAAGSLVTQHDVQQRVASLEISGAASDVRIDEVKRRADGLEVRVHEQEVLIRDVQLHIEKMLARVCAKLEARCED